MPTKAAAVPHTEAQLETHQGVNTKVYDPWMDLFLSDEDWAHCLKNKTFEMKKKKRWMMSSNTWELVPSVV